MDVHGTGAKGSVKNRIYQFWLIQFFIKQKKKRKQKKQLKEKRKYEALQKRKREVLELMREEAPTWKLSKAPTIFQKKEGIVVVLHPIGKKPERVVEIIEEKKKVGIAEDTKKAKIKKKAKDVLVETKKAIAIKPQKKEEYQEKLEKLKNLKMQVETLQIEYGHIMKKEVQTSKNKKEKTTLDELEEAEQLCKKELKQVKLAIEQATKINPGIKKAKPTEPKLGVKVIALAGGTVIAFPAILKASLKPKRKVQNERTSSSLVAKTRTKKTTLEKNKEDNNIQKFKLYQKKLHASKEAEILIQSEINRQKAYLKALNEKVGQLSQTVKIKYHFEGIHHLIGNIFKLALGVLTIPFSKKKIFGTMVGIVLINNSIRGIKNSFRPKKEQISYIQFHDFSKVIYQEKLSLLKTKDLIVDSLSQISDLKKELEYRFYGNVSFEEYDHARAQINMMEQKLLEKQKEIEQFQISLEKAEEQNKVKIKQMEMRSSK